MSTNSVSVQSVTVYLCSLKFLVNISHSDMTPKPVKVTTECDHRDRFIVDPLVQ